MEKKTNPIISDLKTLEKLINRAVTQSDVYNDLIVLRNMVRNTIKAGYEITPINSKEIPADYIMD